MIHYISSSTLSIDDAAAIVREGHTLAISPQTADRINRCRRYLDRKAAQNDEPIYGVTTGFGSLCNISIDRNQLAALQRNLVMSHACGAGERVPHEVVRLIMLLKIESLGHGHSGVQLATVERLVEMYNRDIMPVIYQQGSLGASGDLAPLAHLSLPLLGLGEVEVEGRTLPSSHILEQMGWQALELQSKEGLALLNGTQFMCAYALWAVISSRRLIEWADTIGALSLDAYDGLLQPFDQDVHLVRPHSGQIATAAHVCRILHGSQLANRHKEHVQDPYSFRCIPQVHGSVRDTIDYVGHIVTTEMNSVTDNPTIFPDEDKVISGGNFHGEPLALAMDFLAIALSELASISERRIYKLISGTRSLPKFLVAMPGLNSGFMIPQYTAAGIVSQNKGLCMPASVDSIPSSQGQEDHVSMGANAATKLARVVDNTRRVLAIELFNAAQALEFRRPLRSSEPIENMVAALREQIPFIETDQVMYPHIAQAEEFIDEYEIDC